MFVVNDDEGGGGRGGEWGGRVVPVSRLVLVILHSPQDSPDGGPLGPGQVTSTNCAASIS